MSRPIFFSQISKHICSTEPNDESAANVDAAKIWREDRERFNELARKTVRKSLGLWGPFGAAARFLLPASSPTIDGSFVIVR